ncbi:MAG: beta-ketoacyl-ACP synthase 3 [Clostridia bacterium]|nr:beta-ketoacyl-ACP synthase 3 [Clostridia bacterium]
MSFRIIGTGSALPKTAVTNEELTRFLDTSDEWIRTRTGITERRVMDDSESLLSLATAACQNALEMAHTDPDQIQLIVCTTLTGDYISPALSCLIAKELGLSHRVITLDTNMGCCGFEYGLQIAHTYFASGVVTKKAIVVSAEALSRHADWTDRSTCCLFGDASGAVVLEAAPDRKIDFDWTVSGNAEVLNITRHADNSPWNSYDEKGILHMNGQEVFKFAVSSISARIGALLEKNRLAADDIAKFFLHQANIRIINSAIHKMGVAPEKFPHNIERLGNTSSATIPVLLDETVRAGGLQRGDKIVLCAFGAGLASIACLLEY